MWTTGRPDPVIGAAYQAASGREALLITEGPAHVYQVGAGISPSSA